MCTALLRLISFWIIISFLFSFSLTPHPPPTLPFYSSLLICIFVSFSFSLSHLLPFLCTDWQLCFQHLSSAVPKISNELVLQLHLNCIRLRVASASYLPVTLLVWVRQTAGIRVPGRSLCLFEQEEIHLRARPSRRAQDLSWGALPCHRASWAQLWFCRSSSNKLSFRKELGSVVRGLSLLMGRQHIVHG